MYPNIEKQNEMKKASPYLIFFNLYKPSRLFKRSASSPPDFQIVVINQTILKSKPNSAQTTPMPTFQETYRPFRHAA